MEVLAAVQTLKDECNALLRKSHHARNCRDPEWNDYHNQWWQKRQELDEISRLLKK